MTATREEALPSRGGTRTTKAQTGRSNGSTE